MTARPPPWEFARAFWADWGERMSGPASVPLMIAALFIPNRYVAIGAGLLGIACGVFAAYRVWSTERSRVIELEKISRADLQRMLNGMFLEKTFILGGEINLCKQYKGMFALDQLCMEFDRVEARAPGGSVADIGFRLNARREILKWAEKRSGGRLPNDAWEFQGFEYFSGGRNSVGLRIQNDGSDIWAIRADDPDKSIPGRVWTTEIVVGLMRGEQPRFSARLLASTSEGELNIEPHTPGFVQQVVEKCGLWLGPYEINAEPWVIDTEEEAEGLIAMLVDKNRQLPVFVLTVPEGAANPHQPLLDASSLARAVLGTGHVVILPAAFTWTLTQRFGKSRSVFGGAVRAYLPGFVETANPYAHRLVLVDHLSTPDGRAQCTRWMRSLAATESLRRSTLGRDVLAFAEIRNSSLAFRQQQLKQIGASDKEQLDAANARIDALEKQFRDQKASLEYFDSEHQEAEERAETAEEQARASTFRIQQLIEQLQASGQVADVNVELPEAWADFSSWCDVYLAGRVVLTPAARHAVRAPMFSDVQMAARCLLWLANNCRTRRLEGGEGSLRDEVVEEGIRNSHCGEDQFDLTWQGQRYTADWHIKSGGNTRDPIRCLRIYYFV